MWKTLEQFPWVEMVTVYSSTVRKRHHSFPPAILRDLIRTVRDQGLAFLVCEEDQVSSLRGSWSMQLDISSTANQVDTDSKAGIEIFLLCFF